MNPYLEITRPNVCILATLGVFTGALLSGITDTTNLITALLAAILICAAGNTINDYFDYKIDKINQPNRPIPSKRITLTNAKIYYLILSITGLTIASIVNTQFLSIAIINFFIATIYAWKLKKLPLIGNIADSFLASVTFLAGALIENTYTTLYDSPVTMLAIIAFLTTMGREILKDCEDQEGDKKDGAKTLPILIGQTRSETIAKLFIIVATITATIPYLNHTLNKYYMISVIPAIIVLLHSTDIKSPKDSQKTIKKGMFLGIIAFIIGALTA